MASRLKKTLETIDSEILLTSTKAHIAQQKFQKYSALLGKKSKEKALMAKMECKAYEIFLQNLIALKEKAETQINIIFKKYNLKKGKEIFTAFFIEEKKIEEIANELNLEAKEVEKVVNEIGEHLWTTIY